MNPKVQHLLELDENTSQRKIISLDNSKKWNCLKMLYSKIKTAWKKPQSLKTSTFSL